MFYRLALFLALGFCFLKWINSACSLDPNQDCNIGTEITSGNISQFLAYSRKLGNRRSSEGLQNFKPSKGTNLLTLIILAGDIEMNPGPRFLCRLCNKYCKATDKFVTCNDCKKRFHATCANPIEIELSSLKNENEPWYCSDCKADCGLCSGAVLNSHKAVQCDKCEMWVHNKCSLVSDNQYENIQNSNCSWICPKCDFFNFSDSFFSDQLNLEEQNRFVPLSNDSSCGTKTCESGTNKNKFISGLKFSSININSIRGKKT